MNFLDILSNIVLIGESIAALVLLYEVITDKQVRKKEFEKFKTQVLLLLGLCSISLFCILFGRFSEQEIDQRYWWILGISTAAVLGVAGWLWSRDYPQGSNYILLGSLIITISGLTLYYSLAPSSLFDQLSSSQIPAEVRDYATSTADLNNDEIILFLDLNAYRSRPELTVYFQPIEAYRGSFEMNTAEVVYTMDNRSDRGRAEVSGEISVIDAETSHEHVTPTLTSQLPYWVRNPHVWLSASATIQITYTVKDENGIEQEKTETLQRELKIYVASAEDAEYWEVKAEQAEPLSLETILLLIGGIIIGGALIRWGWRRDHR